MKLSIVILNYNTKDLLKQTLESIKTSQKAETIVVDNASTDDSIDMLKNNFPRVKIVQNKQNLGFAAGNNQGIKVAKGKYILLLNSDTQIQDNAIDKCINYLDKHSQVGILTPKLILSDGAIDLASHRGFPTPLNSLAYFTKLEQLFPNFKPFSGYHQTWKDFDTTHPVDVVSGASMFIRDQVIKDIGLLDEQFFMYAEDIDFCKRAYAANWQIVYYPKATVIHHKGQSGTKSKNQQTKSKTRQHFYLTMKQYFNKHHSQDYPKPVHHLINLSIDILTKLRG